MTAFRWFEKRAAESRDRQARAMEQQETALKEKLEVLNKQVSDVVDALVEAGFTPIRRFTSNLDRTRSNFYAMRDSILFEVTVTVKGAVYITIVK